MESAGYRRENRLARVLTEVLAPAHLVAALVLAVAWRYATSPAQALVSGLLAALFASIVPITYVLRGVRQQRWSDRHVRKREERSRPILFGIASVTVGVVVLGLVGAPRELRALVIAMVVGLVTALLVTLFWKISVHVAVAAGTVTILVLVFGTPMLALTPLIAAVAWARVALGDHTVAQTIAGAVQGAVVAATIYPLLR